jgi:CheY-like chemotaxis protein
MSITPNAPAEASREKFKHGSNLSGNFCPERVSSQWQSTISAHPEINLLFTDIAMPGMNGRKLADEVARSRPEIKVLFTTGFTRNAVVHGGVLDAGVNFISKPFTIEQLAAKVSGVFAQPAM